jgi:hypothetical protein
MTSRRRAKPPVQFVALLLGVALSTPLAPRVAWADKPSKQALSDADRHFRRGIELYGEADFRAALTEFRRAYEIAPNFRALYNIAQAHYQLNDYAAALDTFERYLAEGKDEVPPARRTDVEKELAKLRGRVATVTFSPSESDAELLLDDVSLGQAPLAPQKINAGEHLLRASKAGFSPATKRFEVAGGDVTTVSLVLVPVAPAEVVQAPPPPPPAPKMSLGLILGWAGTGALAAGTAITGVLALNASDELRDAKAVYGTTKGELESLDSKVRVFGTTADVLGLATVAAAGVCTFLTVRTYGSTPSRKGAVTTSLYGTPRSLGVAVAF